MNEYIKRLRDQKKHLAQEYERISDLLETQVSNCEHQFTDEPQYHDSHHDYYNCTICGEEFSDTQIALHIK